MPEKRKRFGFMYTKRQVDSMRRSNPYAELFGHTETNWNWLTHIGLGTKHGKGFSAALELFAAGLAVWGIIHLSN